MNGSVDSRVVEMHFDNSDFMDKIEETIDALERLNNQISNINAAQGLSNLTSGADVGLSNVENSLGNIESRFSILGIVGMTIVQRLTNAAIDGIQKVSSLLGAAARQTRQGGFIRAENIEQAKFLLEGLGADVEGVFDRVDKAVTGTSYGIDEAAKAASSFYASGITNLDKLQDSLRAVAGVAAMTGSDYASIADIFTTVAGQGKVMTMQLRMMEGRGLNAAATMAKYFKGVNDGSIEASDAVKESIKKLTSSTEVSEEAIREFVNKGKIDFEVFSAAMDNAFGKHAQEANKTFSGSLANLKTSLSRLGEAFYTPGMKAAIPVFNSLRETFSNLTTNLKSSKLSQRIDEITKSIKESGKATRKDLSDLESIGINPYKKIQEYFNGVSDGSIKASESMKGFVKKVTKGKEVTEDQIRELARNGKISFKIFDAALGDSLSKLKEISNTDTLVAAFTKKVSALGSSISYTIERFNKSDIISNTAKSLFYSFSALSKILHTVKEAFKEVFPGSFIKSMEDFSSKILDISKKAFKFTESIKNIKAIENVFVGLFSGIKAAYNIVSGFFGVLSDAIKTIFGLTGKVGGLSEAFRNLMHGLDEKTGTIGIFEKLSKLLDGIGKLADKTFDKFANGIGKIITAISEGIGSIDSMDKALGVTMFLFGALFSQKTIRKLLSWKNRLSKEFVSLWKMFDLGRGYDKDGNKRFLITSDFTDVLKSATRYLKQMTLQVNADIVKKIALSVLALAVALKVMETVKPERLQGSLEAITVLMGEVTLSMAALLTLLNKSDFTGTMKGVLAIGGISNALIKLALSMILMAVALKMIAELDPKELAMGLSALTIMLGAVLGFILLLDKHQKVAMDDKAGKMLMGIAVSLLVMAKAIQMLASLKPVELAKGLGSVIILLGSVFGFFTGLSKMNVSMGPGLISAGLGMIAIAAAINILVPALQKLGSMPLEQLAHGLEAVIAAIIAMAVASNMASLQGGAGILMLALGLGTLTTSIQRLGSMDINSLTQGLVALAIALGIMIAAGYALAPISEILLVVGGSMLMMAGSIAILGAGLVLIGAGLTSISAGILAFATVTSTALTMFINTMQQVIIGLIQMVPAIAAALAKGFVSFLEQIAALAPRFTKAATTIISSLLDGFSKNASKIVRTGLRLIINLLSGIREATPRIAKEAAGIITGFINGIAEKMDDIVDAGFNLVLSFINGLANGIRDHKDDVKTAIENLCLAILEAFMSFFGISSPSRVMKKQGEYLVEGLRNGVSSGKGKSIGSILVGFVSGAFKNISGFIKKFGEKGRDIAVNIGNGIKDKGGDLKEKVKAALKKAKEKVSDYKGKFKTAGKNLSEGIGSGIKNGKSSVISAAGDIASKALNKFKEALGINSPSKVFAREAGSIPEGVALGIKKSSRLVTKAVNNMAGSAINSMSEAVSDIYSYLDADFDYNPTITPILDLSEVNRDADSISSILANRSISLASSVRPSGLYSEQNNLMNKLINKMDRYMNSSIGASVNNFTFNVDGAENPEDFAKRFVRQVELEMRTG